MKNNGANITRVSSKEKTVRLAKMGMLVAISILLVSIIHLPIFPAVPYLEYDPADIPILIGAFTFGPLAGLALTIVTAIIQGVTVSASGQLYGIIMHILATGALVTVASGIYNIKKTKKNAIIGLILGVISMTVIMVFANILITPLFLGLPRESVYPLLPFIGGFNVIKGAVNGSITFILYKRISKYLS